MMIVFLVSPLSSWECLNHNVFCSLFCSIPSIKCEMPFFCKTICKILMTWFLNFFHRFVYCLPSHNKHINAHTPYPTCVPQNSMENSMRMKMNAAPLFSPKTASHPFHIYWLLFNLTFNANIYFSPFFSSFEWRKSSSFWCKTVVSHIIWIIQRRYLARISSSAWKVAFFELFAQKLWRIRRFEQ